MTIPNPALSALATASTPPTPSALASKVPAADATLRVLSLLARQRAPLPAARIAAELDLPRSTTYDLLSVLVEHGYVLHLAQERRYAIGPSAYEVAAGYARHAPLARVGRRVVERLVDATGESGHLASLSGSDVLYIVEERAKGRTSLVTDIGVRLPAHLTATGRAMLAQLTPAQLRTLHSGREELLRRTDAPSPSTPRQLRELLRQVRADGVAWESGEVTEGFRSVAAAVLDQAGWPVAAVALTWEEHRVDEGQAQHLADRVQEAAGEIARMVSGRRAG
ncbi:IclR family transcriptional regulator [Brachybacterium muris]|uniref:IclR family transcriptional regulator n=1 Tax=Brachybacterium muris TaxID=219301 RepID=UPI00223A721E|nr:IclR family transcriptional regulator [Brachybacterium muris]MCT2260054.1 IclR family transcriptional regulator [Brachybacterium muris]